MLSLSTTVQQCQRERKANATGSEGNLHGSVIGANVDNARGPGIHGIPPGIPMNGVNPVPFQTNMIPKISHKGYPPKGKRVKGRKTCTGSKYVFPLPFCT